MTAVAADTHVVLWSLYSPQRLSPAATTALNQAIESGGGIYLSAITLVEVAYLAEKERIPWSSYHQLIAELSQPDSALYVIPLDFPISQYILQVPRVEVSEMPDRIIAATAKYLNMPLVTRDRQLRAANLKTIW